MKNRTASLLLAASLIAAAVFSTTAHAQEEPPPTTVPEVVQIEDPAGDANYGSAIGQADSSTPADLTVSDILKVWFSNDAENISVHIQTEGPPPSSNAAYLFQVSTNPGDEEDGCLEWVAVVEGPSYAGEPFARLEDVCAGTDPIEAVLTVEAMADETGLISITVPRAANALFAAGSSVSAPWAQARNATGLPQGFLNGPVADNTQVGTDYLLVDQAPGKGDPPGKGKKKGCTKGKGKKKGACPGGKDGNYSHAAGRVLAI
jgi:hypothetical protein